jgi:protoporphyrinogen oxidase
MIERFFRPFLGGIFLDPTLHTSSRMFNFVFRMFALGNACLPSQGMEAIPRQLASALSPKCIRFGSKVVHVQPGSVTLDSGERMQASIVVVAAEGASAAQLLGDPKIAVGQGVTCFYFVAPRPPVEEPILVLNGDASGPVNNLCVLTNTAPSYASRDESLVSATVLSIPDDEVHLREEVRAQLFDWFGAAVDDWRHLRTYRIPYALPRQRPPALAEPVRSVRWQRSLYVCGDHRDNASIQGAMVSGRRAAEALIEDLS